MGTLLTAERPGMSQRVRRRLPQSFFGRMFFSWFNPGPASGYMFVIANITTLAILCFDCRHDRRHLCPTGTQRLATCERIACI